MPFRGAEPDTGTYVPDDPYARFLQLQSALTADAGWLQDRTPMRLAAVTLLTTPGEPDELAAQLRSHDAALSLRLGWMSNVQPPVRLLLSALLLKYGDDAAEFLTEADRVIEMMREAKVRRGGAYDYFVVAILRRVRDGAPVLDEDVVRVRLIYEQMKRYHWWLTGTEDLPACAMLASLPGDPETIGDGIEAMYQALRKDAGLSRGDPLQTAANVLYLSGLAPDEVAERFSLLKRALLGEGQKVWQREYDEVASLCFLPIPVERVAETVVGFRDRLCDELELMTKPVAFSLAAAIAFVYLASRSEGMEQMADVKALLDVQAIVAAQQAAMIAAVTVAST